MNENRNKKILKPTIVAERLIVDRRTLDNWRSAGRGPAYIKISGRKIGYLESDIDEFVSQRRINPEKN